MNPQFNLRLLKGVLATKNATSRFSRTLTTTSIQNQPITTRLWSTFSEKLISTSTKTPFTNYTENDMKFPLLRGSIRNFSSDQNQQQRNLSSPATATVDQSVDPFPSLVIGPDRSVEPQGNTD